MNIFIYTYMNIFMGISMNMIMSCTHLNIYGFKCVCMAAGQSTLLQGGEDP